MIFFFQGPASTGRFLMVKADYCDRHEKEWLEERYAKYFQYALDVAYQITREREAAQDLAQEAFLRILVAMAEGRYARTSEFQTYLHRVVRNLSLNHVMRRKEISFEPPPLELTKDTDDPDLQNRIDRMDALKYLSALSPQHRKVFILYYLKGKSYAEIASRLGISKKSVGNILYRGKKKIRGFLKNNEEWEGGGVFK